MIVENYIINIPYVRKSTYMHCTENDFDVFVAMYVSFKYINSVLKRSRCL